MSGEFHIYDPNDVSLIAAGVPIEGGFADGTFIEVVQDSDDFVDVVGADGDVTRSKTNDRRATITITLGQGALGNQLLSAVSNLDKSSSGGAGVGPFLLKDNQGTTIFSAEKSWVAKAPDAGFDKTAGSRAWKIRCAHLVRNDGTN